MQRSKIYILLVSGFFLFLIISCSNPKADYDEVQQILNTSEKTIQQSFDYEIRIKACDDAIASLNKFIQKHKEGEWSNVAKNSLNAWESQRTSFQQELTDLSNELYAQLKDKAIEESKRVHSFSNIENIALENRNQSKIGSFVKVTDVYSVRMRGAIIGNNIFKLLVTVSGRIGMESKKVFVDEKAVVEE